MSSRSSRLTTHGRTRHRSPASAIPGLPDTAGILRALTLRANPDPERCVVAPSPELRERIQTEVERLRASGGRRAIDAVSSFLQVRQPERPGLNDGLIIPGDYYPVGTPLGVVRSAAADRAPLRGTVRVIVVLVDFADQAMGAGAAARFNDLFFSTGVIATGSVREYFTEVSNGLIDITGEVVGPYRLPRTLAQYANGASGMGGTAPNARTMARDAIVAADPAVNFGPYDNDGNGFVDAFIVVHAGPGAEQTGNDGHIWSHKWVLEGGEYATDGTRIYAYLTVPEDSRIGVCCHELGHLAFGWPDLYDTDQSSEGIGNWCLMAGGSWNAAGDVPAHPSAWCKAGQGWVSVVNQTTNATVNVADVKDSHTVYRLWKDGAGGSEYFLVENRQRNRYDARLPGDGLLIWHIDDAIPNNSNEAHYKVALMQADGLRQLEGSGNRGDPGDPFPGSANNTSFTNTSNPNSRSYGGVNTCVSVTAIGPSGPVMPAQFTVRCAVVPPPGGGKNVKDAKDRVKERIKEFRKDVPDGKGTRKEFVKDVKDVREKPIIDKSAARDKSPISEKPGDKFRDKGNEGGFRSRRGEAGLSGRVAELEARVAELEAELEATEPFIGSELRPDLSQGALLGEDDLAALQEQMAAGDAAAKRLYDSKAPES